VNQTVDETREPIKESLAELEATLVRARETMEDIQAIVVLNEANIGETLENFRAASQNVEQLTDELRQRPWSLIRMQPKPDRQVPVPAAAGAGN
jgi:ABC-type transporter Mla subunit MlaD